MQIREPHHEGGLMFFQRSLIITVVAILLWFTVSCSGSEQKVSRDRVFTLYRDSVTDQNIRIHIATFDVDEKETYNKENCSVAQELFKNQPGVKVKYWCEKGYFKK